MGGHWNLCTIAKTIKARHLKFKMNSNQCDVGTLRWFYNHFIIAMHTVAIWTFPFHQNSVKKLIIFLTRPWLSKTLK